MKLNDRIAVVTGASEGIGAALARLFVREGALVALAARQEEKLRTLAEELGTDATLVVPTDVSQSEQVQRLFRQTVERFGGIDILVNNAGVGLYASVAEMRREVFRWMWEVNFFGVVECIQQALPQLEKRRGVVVNISSVAGKFAIPYMAGYCGTKYALNGFSTALRMELIQRGVRVVLVSPGRVKTTFHQNAMRDSEEKLPGQYKRPVGGISAEAVARATLKAILKGRQEIVVPARYRALIGFRNLFPRFTDGMIARFMR